MRHLLPFLLFLATAVGCSISAKTPPIHESRVALEASAFTLESVPCECRSEVGPFPWGSPIVEHHTEVLPASGVPLAPCPQGDMDCMVERATPLACTTDAECQPDAVKGCRHAKCNTDCGFCVFSAYPPCQADTCTMQGHHSTCQTAADCIDAPYYGTDCIGGLCLILPPTASGFYCAAPGDLRPVGQ